MTLHGCKVLVVGGASRMGLATAQACAAAGANVILSGRSADKLTAAVAQISHGATAAAGDFTQLDQAAAVMQPHAPIDHVVVTLSVAAPVSSVNETPPDQAQAVFARY